MEQPVKEWNELSEWEQTKFIIRIFREMFAITDTKLEHMWIGDGSAYDSGILNWKLFKQLQEESLIKKKKVSKIVKTKKEVETNNTGG